MVLKLSIAAHDEKPPVSAFVDRQQRFHENEIDFEHRAQLHLLFGCHGARRHGCNQTREPNRKLSCYF